MKQFLKVSGIVLAAPLLLASAGIGLVYARFTWWNNREKVDSPILAYLHPIARTPISANDTLEVLRLSGWRPRPIRIRIYGDGHVDRDTTFVIFNGKVLGCPPAADKHLHIPPKKAVELLARAGDGGFADYAISTDFQTLFMVRE